MQSSPQSNDLKITFSINMMVSFDHVLMLYKTNVENMLEDKTRKGLQRALTQEPSICHDQLQQILRQQVCQGEYADAESTEQTHQLRRHLIAEQAEAMQRFESHSQQFVSQHQEEYAHKQQTQVQQFDGVIRDKDEVMAKVVVTERRLP